MYIYTLVYASYAPFNTIYIYINYFLS